MRDELDCRRLRFQHDEPGNVAYLIEGCLDICEAIMRGLPPETAPDALLSDVVEQAIHDLVVEDRGGAASDQARSSAALFKLLVGKKYFKAEASCLPAMLSKQVIPSYPLSPDECQTIEMAGFGAAPVYGSGWEWFTSLCSHPASDAQLS